MGEKLLCSFCGKSQHAVRKMIAGPGGVIICNECVDLCSDLFSEETIKKWAGRIATRIIKARRWLRGSGKERAGWRR